MLSRSSCGGCHPHFFAHMAAALGSGKTSFLRLLLDTSIVSPRTTKDQLASVAKFVHGCSGHTSYIRAASIDINLDLDGSGQQQTLSLTLIDTPSLDLRDEVPAERLLSETLRHIDSRFAEGIEDVRRLSFPPSSLKAISLHRNGKQRRATAMCTCESWLLSFHAHRSCPPSPFPPIIAVSTFWTRTKLSRRLFRLHLPRSFPEPAPTAFPSQTTSPSFWSPPSPRTLSSHGPLSRRRT